MVLFQKLSRDILLKRSFQATLAPRVVTGLRFIASEMKTPAATIENTHEDDLCKDTSSGIQLPEAQNSGEKRIAVASLHMNNLEEALAEFYVIENVQDECPTIHDILRAKNGSMGKDWDYVRYEKDGREVHARSQELIKVKQGDPLLSIPLPDVL